MLFICTILFIFFIIVKSPLVFGHVPLRTDYYESFSNPAIYMEISHNFPIGPPYLYSSFSYHRYSSISGNNVTKKFTKYIFKRVEKRCETSVIFTMLGNDFDRLEITNSIYLSVDIDYLATFEYTFYSGFTPGIYGLIDIYNNFGMRVKVLNESENYLGNAVSLEDTAKSYLQSSTTQSGQLCVISKNNHAVVLDIYFAYNAPSGFIYGFQALTLRNGTPIGDRIYPAYSCQSDVSYPDIDTIFMIDYLTTHLTLKVLFLGDEFRKHKLFQISHAFNSKVIEILHPKISRPGKIKNFTRKYNALFLIKIDADFKMCQDGSWITSYHSMNDTRYFVDAQKKTKILPSVELTRKIYRSLQDPCGELKK